MRRTVTLQRSTSGQHEQDICRALYPVCLGFSQENGRHIFRLVTQSLTNCDHLFFQFLGTDFILPGGCPAPQCNPSLRDCRKEHLEMEEVFTQCMTTKSAKQGCFTDRLPDGKLFTIPVLANFCSKHCVSDNSLESIHECPYEGFIHTALNPDLERRIKE